MSRRIEPHTVLSWLLLLVIITSHFGCAYSFRSRSIAQNSDDLTLYPAPINPSNSGRNDTSAPPHLTAGFALNVTVDVPVCDNDPSRRGSAELNSCIDAIERVPDTKDSLFDSNTKRPFRYSSSDGRCAIEATTGYNGAHPRSRVSITGEDLRSVAGQILQECVIKENAGGGQYYMDNADILFSLQSYDTSNVRCLADRSPEPAPSGCDEALADMPASNKYIAYKQNPPFFAHDIRVPEMILDATHNCNITVDHTSEEAVIGRPVQVWRAAKAIDAMCVRQGRGGWALGLGYNQFASADKLYVVIENGHNRAPFRPKASGSPGAENHATA